MIIKVMQAQPAAIIFIKDFADELLLFLLTLWNYALGEGSFPASEKWAIVLPSFKQPDLDVNNMVNYWPIANLSFLSKMAEKYVLIQLKQYFKDNSLLPSISWGLESSIP